ncbi:alpha/beta hydrolase [Sphingorhabdus sp. Alg239-R122]|uniref:alpha/beta hydrolase n=1 Tax=Sphingorhabdus sp. Alg239-R122 TaxID=2305989 RepID=UPI0013D92F84|nr:alpha/beta hydrolase [Sphingorhabdus sp. Alg239-R122]
MMAIAIRFLLFAVGLYLIALALIYIFQRSFMYLPDTQRVSPEQVELDGFSVVNIMSGENKLVSWWHPPVDQTQPVILHFHGNGGALAGRADMYRTLAASGAGLLAVGYPGYGGNAGKAGEQMFYQAARANYGWLRKQGFRGKDIVIAGQSVGTGPAAYLAANTNAAGLILEAPYTSMADMAARQMPLFPSRLLVKDRYENLSRIGKIDMPLAWIHGERDGLIPVQMGQILFDAARQPKCAYRIEKGKHNDLWTYGTGEIILEQAALMVRERRCENRVR